MNGIKLVRVDFRLIHGQVITKWSKKVSANKIIVINDELSKDEFMSGIYVMAAPPNVDVEVISEDEFVEGAEANKYDSGNILILFKSIKDVVNVLDKGISFNEVQIGGLGAGNGRRTVVRGIAIDREDADHLIRLQDAGAEVTFQVTPEETKLKLDSALKKLKD